MLEQATDARLLQGQQVVLAGKLASMTRSQAMDLIRAKGGEWASSISRKTTLVVVGQEGWPLRKDGRLGRSLQKARRLQRSHPIKVVTESDFLAQLGLEASYDGQRFSVAHLSQILQVPGRRIRRWVELGLVQSIETTAGIHYFDFRQVTWAKTLWSLLRNGVTTARIRRSLEQLHQWLPEVDQSLHQLTLLERDGQLLVRMREGSLAEPGGQCLFDFSHEPPPASIAVPTSPATADEWFQAGYAEEQAGRLGEAAHAYQQLLLVGGPDALGCFNLANVLYALGRKAAAAERYREAVELDGQFFEAWNNLGTALADLDRREEAVEAYQNALAANPQYAEAHYNLADLLEEIGRRQAAMPHWQAYVRLEPRGSSADYARHRLSGADRKKNV